MMDHVVIGCSTQHDYDFPLPLTALLWRDRIGHWPVLLLARDQAHWRSIPRSSTVLDAIKELGFEHHFIGIIDEFSDGTCAQSARQHVAAIPTPDDQYILLSDADLWPIRREFYHQHDRSKYVTFWYANAYGYENHCSCHMGARAVVWREVMELKADGNLTIQLRQTLERELRPRMEGKTPSEAGWEAWNFDEWNTSRRFREFPWYPDGCQMIERHGAPPVDRIDRSNWAGENISGMVDCHMLRPAQQDGNWGRVLSLFRNLLPGRVAWAQAYRDRYMQEY